LSIGLQVTAAVLALRLIRVTERALGWVLIAAAVLLMAGRRCTTFFGMVSGSLSSPPDLATEGLALLISVCMLAGIAYIAPMFLSMKHAEAAQRTSEAELHKQQEE